MLEGLDGFGEGSGKFCHPSEGSPLPSPFSGLFVWGGTPLKIIRRYKKILWTLAFLFQVSFFTCTSFLSEGEPADVTTRERSTVNSEIVEQSERLHRSLIGLTRRRM